MDETRNHRAVRLTAAAGVAVASLALRELLSRMMGLETAFVVPVIVLTTVAAFMGRAAGFMCVLVVCVGHILVEHRPGSGLVMPLDQVNILFRFAIVSSVIILTIDKMRQSKIKLEKTDSELRRRNEELAILSGASSTLLVENDPARMVSKVFELVHEWLGCDVRIHHLFEPSLISASEGHFRIVGTAGLTDEQVSLIGQSDRVAALCARCAKSLQPITEARINLTPDPANGVLGELGLKLLMTFPLLANGKILGTLSIGSRKKEAFSGAEIAMIDTLRFQIAAAQDRVRTQQAFHDSDESLRLGSLVAGLAVARVDYRNNWVHLDPAAARLYGYPPENIVITRDEWHARIHPDDHKRYDMEIDRALQSGGESEGWVATELRVIWPDGTVRWLNIRKQLYFETKSNGLRKPIYAITAARDITDDKQSESVLRTMYETSLIGIIRFTREGRITDANDAFLQMIGWTRIQFENEGLSNKNICVGSDDQSSARALEEFAKTGRIKPFEKEYRGRDGRIIQALVSANTLDPESNRHGVAFIVDLSHIKAVEQELRVLTENLEMRVRQRTNELDERSRQLRGLALDMAETETRERKRLAQILHDHFQQLISAAKLKVGIVRRRNANSSEVETYRQIESLLDEAITESRSLARELSPPVLHDAGLKMAFEWLARKMQSDHHLTVSIRAESDNEPDNESVRMVLFECVRELLFNVVKHSGARTAELIMRMQIPALLSIVVRDPGKGFDINRDLTKHTPDGSFGLFSIRERLGMLGGLLDIRSVPDMGTEIEITLPITTRPQGVIDVGVNSTPQEAAQAALTKAVQVLVADDHKLFREGLITLLKQEPYLNIVGEASDGAEAVEMARKLRPQILILDVSMPKMTGIEVASTLRRELPSLRIIGLSMHERDDMARALKDAGAYAYCTKGGSTEMLLGVLKAAATEPDAVEAVAG